MIKVVDGNFDKEVVIREELRKRQYLGSMDMLSVTHKTLELETNEKFDLFMLFDILEYLEDTDRLSEKIKSLAGDVYNIVGNIPLYPSREFETFKRTMNIDILNEDMAKMGCSQITHYVYGAHGWPHLFWEATNG